MAEAATTTTGAAPQEGNTAPAPQASTMVDWEAVELAYRAGVLSVREIAKQHGITHGAVRKRALRDKWGRDLSAKVRKAVSTQLVSTEVSTIGPATERAAIDAAAATVVALVREHRRDISGQRSLAETLKAQLEEAIGNRELIEAAIEEETETALDAPGYVKTQAAAQRKQMLRAVSLPGHITALKDLSTVLKNLLPLERQAFNVDAAPDAPVGVVMGDSATAVTLAGIEAFRQKLATLRG
jgi:hypothetical protein